MASYTKLSGDVGATPSAAKFWREETRLWYVKIVNAASTLVCTVHASEADADAGANTVASGAQAISTTEHTVTLSNGASAPTFTGASFKVTLTSTSWTGTTVWKVDLGPKLERAVLRVLRGFDTYVDGTSDYHHDLDTVELGPKQWEDVDRDDSADFPYVGIGRASAQTSRREIGTYPGPTTRTFMLQGVAHNEITGDSVDSNGMWLFHDLRRALIDLNDETYTGDGTVFDEATIDFADFDRPVEWARDRVSVSFDVTVQIQELRSEMDAG